MEKRIKISLIILSVISLIVFGVEFFGTIAFFSPAMFLLVPLVFFGSLCYFLPRGISLVVSLFKKEQKNKIVIGIIAVLFISTPISILYIGGQTQKEL